MNRHHPASKTGTLANCATGLIMQRSGRPDLNRQPIGLQPIALPLSYAQNGDRPGRTRTDTSQIQDLAHLPIVLRDCEWYPWWDLNPHLQERRSCALAIYATRAFVGDGAPGGSRNPFVGLRIRRPSAGLQEHWTRAAGCPARRFVDDFSHITSVQ